VIGAKNPMGMSWPWAEKARKRTVKAKTQK